MNKELISLIILQLIAHLLSDFYFQWDKMVEQKKKKSYQSKYMYLHILITFAISWVLSFQWGFWWVSFIIVVVHLILDIVKSSIEKKKKYVPYLFLSDQILHLATLTGVSLLFAYYHKVSLPDFALDIKILLVIAGFLLIIKPANFLIKEIFGIYKISIPDQNDLKNAGKLIGNIERVLILIFILIAQYEAIGFLLAAKSILRYNEQDKLFPNKTEYVLAGTFMSFTIAIITGLIITKINL